MPLDSAKRAVYDAWIAAWRAKNAWKGVIGGDGPGGMNGTTKGMCGRAVKEMIDAFPEFKGQPGSVRLKNGHGGGEHWWCVTAEGDIVDPTADQFEHGGGVAEYHNWEGPLPTGVCPNCGDTCYTTEHQGCCTAECERDYARYIMSGKDY